MIQAINAAAPKRTGENLTLDHLLGAWPRPADAPWYAELRERYLSSFREADKSFGRYSRLRLDWSALQPVTPRFKTVDVQGVLRGDIQPLSTALGTVGEAALAPLLRPQNLWDRLLLAGWREGAYLQWGSDDTDGKARGLCIECDSGLSLEPVVLDVAARAEALLFIRWSGSPDPAFRLTSLLGRVGDGATLKVVLLHDAEAEHHLIQGSLELGRDASVEVFGAWVGGKWTVARFGAELAQPGSNWRETHVILTDGKEHLDLDSQVLQAARHTSCDVQVKTVAAGESRAIFTGNILMETGAVQSAAHLSDHVLLLSRGARADSIPGLEIKAADVTAAHAASVGQVDEEQIFYLESRGLSREEATHLIVVGFLRSVLDRSPMESLPDLLDPILESKVAS
jgi:hypothetical protein